MAWVALAPLALAILRAARRARSPLRHAFLTGVVAGLGYFTGTVYWVTNVMAFYGGLSTPVAAGVAALLIAYLAIYPGLAALVTVVAVRRAGLAGLWLLPFAWTAAEYGRGVVLGGFPWVLLGTSQAPVLPVAQLASVTGVYGLSWLLAASGTALGVVIASRGQAWKGAAALTALVAAIWAWGAWRLDANVLAGAGTPVRVGIVQGNVPQDEKWDPANARDILYRYIDGSREVVDQGARFVLWPESATPFFYEEEPAGRRVIEDFARETGATLLFGSDQVERGTPPRYYNSAFLVGPDGTTRGVYRKVHLVPFGEYVPLKQLLFFAAPLVEAVSDFSPGDEVVMLPLAGAPISCAICYEVVYPTLSRRAVRRGSRLLTTITNDAWFGRSSAAYQHFDQAAVRAVEHGRYLVRAANTGVSGIVDPYGRVLARTDLFVTTTVTGDVRLLEGLTVYGKMGDLAVWVSLAICVLALLGVRKEPTGGRLAR
ncbi:MAG: apolipoprotein N-acyltransferase [Vicinamibacteraceae bacterium]|nr:apolipoprotein N-acyltransferase [Vicinamibacteraceae bacterium]